MIKGSYNVQLVRFFRAMNLKLEILIQVGVNSPHYITRHHGQISDKISSFSWNESLDMTFTV